MLKKTGILVATAALGLLAVSPFAFAAEDSNVNGDTSGGLVNVADNNANVPVQLCNNDVPVQGGLAQAQVPVKDITAAAGGALALLGKAKSSLNQTTDNSRSCGDNSGSAGDVHKQ